jgi:hypothetical protein
MSAGEKTILNRTKLLEQAGSTITFIKASPYRARASRADYAFAFAGAYS